jgi:prepilin-type N-terminal cleavage/methylation domain-containing protein
VIELFNKRREEEGFTLIELLIVIVILGILAAIVVFAVGGTGKNAAVAACKADAKSVETALEAYKAQNGGTFPPSPAANNATDPGWAALVNPAGGSNTPYLRSVPSTAHYTLWWDGTSGAVFVLGANAADPGSDPASGNFDTTTANGGACSVAT